MAHSSLNSDKKRRLAIELWSASTEAKEQLSTSEQATVFLSGNSGPEELVLSAATYDQLTAPLFDTYRAAIAEMLAGSQYGFGDIHHLALAGGSAMARGVLKHTSEVTGRPENEILVSGSSSHVVASGAAIACYTGEEADAHVGRGFGVRLVASANGSKLYTNKMIVPTNTIIKAGGEIYQDTGQRIVTSGGRAKLRIQFVEAKAAVVVPKPEAGIPSLLDDSEVNRLREVTHDVDLPAGEHQVLVGFSISSGSTSYQIGFQDSGIEGVSGRLMSKSFGTQAVAEAEAAADAVEPQAIDLCILLDISGSMDGPKFGNAAIAIENVVNQTANTDVRVAVVVFGAQNGLLCPFGTSQADIIQAVNSLKVGNGTPMGDAFAHGALELSAQRAGSHKLALLVTDGRPDDPKKAEVAANNLKGCAELICFGIGDVDESFLIRIATSPDHYFYTDEPDRIPALFDSILEMFIN
ncbi:MAG: VWA domain-containing protein [Pirellulaceae bacterium]|nr:VWA domain-containing protein [Pirellulaceae bacterium]